MSAAARQVDAALVAELRKLGSGKPHLGDIRRAIGCSTADLKASIGRLRNRGKLHWERIELAPSMLIDQAEGEAPQVAPAPRPTPAPTPPPPAVATQVAAEAAEAGQRRRQAGSISQPWKLDRVRPEGAVEAIQSGLAETPGDLIKAVGRRHPDMWRRVLQLGRAHAVMPSVVLYDALDRGLAAIEAHRSGVPQQQAPGKRAQQAGEPT